MKYKLLTGILAPVLVATTVSANTWIVDDNGGPGVFTTIQAALDAALEGDLILVQAGQYPAFTLKKGVTVLGNVALASEILVGQVSLVTSLDSDEVGRVSNLTLDGLVVSGPKGVLVLDRVVMESLSVTHSKDVRLQGCRSLIASTIRESSVEAVDCEFRGKDGAGGSCGSAESGNTGLWLEGGARVHLARTSVYGGAGGSTGCAQPAASGGAAVFMQAGSELLASGEPGSAIRGGNGGLASFCAFDGFAGSGVVNELGGIFSYSNMVIEPGTSCHTGIGVGILGQSTQLDPGQPTLGWSGAAPAGALVQLDVIGRPLAPVFVFFGTQPVQLPFPGSLLGILTKADLGYVSGVTSASTGQLSFPIKVPQVLSPGTLIPIQGGVFAPTGVWELTNSVAALVSN